MVEDPIKAMVTDAVYARYHDEEFAKKTLLSRFKNIYHPAPTSDIITLEFDWEQGIISEDIKTISKEYLILCVAALGPYDRLE